MNNIFDLAFQRIKRKWKNSLLFFLILLLSFSSAIVSVSLVGSIDRTNREYRLNTYGEWYFAVPYGFDSDTELLSGREWADSSGVSESYGKISSSNGTIGFGTLDDELIRLGHIRLDKGSFPVSDEEIAIEADALSLLGCNYELGQQITVIVSIPAEMSAENNAAQEFIPIEKTYTLCGIIHEYSSLWLLKNNISGQLLSSAIVSEKAACDVLSEANEALDDDSGFSVCKPVFQYFICVSEENREIAKDEINAYLRETRAGGKGDIAVCVNETAYPNVKSAKSDSNDFYIYVIAALTFVSLLCIGIIQLPVDTHSFSVLRSLGISKGQLALLQLTEAAILGIPAVMIGIPLGAGLIGLSLRLMMYSGSVPIQVSIPYETLGIILLLWLASIILSRVIIFVFTLRVPMTGGLKLTAAKSRRAGRLRSGFIILLLCAFSISEIYTFMESLKPEYLRHYWASCPSYTLNKSNNANEKASRLLSQSDIDAVKNVPGISDVYGFSELKGTSKNLLKSKWKGGIIKV